MLYGRSLKVGAIAAALAITACGKKEETTAAPTEAKMSGTLAVTSALAAQGYSLAVSDYVVYCLSFESTPVAKKGTISAAGAFEVTGLTTGVPFGCFINVAATNASKGVMVVENDAASMGGTGESQSISLAGDAALGDLTLGTDGKVKIKASKLASAKSDSTASTDTLAELDDLHSNSFTMSCVSTGDTAADKKCAQNNQDKTVFFRIIKGTNKSGAAMRGIGAWASKAAFDICGSFDMGTKDKAEIEANGYKLDATVTSGTFTNQYDDSSSQNGGKSGADDKCYYRSNYASETVAAGANLTADHLNNVFALEEMKKVGKGWEMRQTEKYTYNMQSGSTSATCECSESTTIVFTRSSATEWAAAFNGDGKCVNTTAGSSATCGDDNGPSAQILKFTKK